MRNLSKHYPKMFAGLLLGTALGVTGTATAQETTQLRGPQIPVECLDPVTGALVLTRENFRLCEPFVSGLAVQQGPFPGRPDPAQEQGLGQAPGVGDGEGDDVAGVDPVGDVDGDTGGAAGDGTGAGNSGTGNQGGTGGGAGGNGTDTASTGGPEDTASGTPSSGETDTASSDDTDTSTDTNNGETDVGGFDQSDHLGNPGNETVPGTGTEVGRATESPGPHAEGSFGDDVRGRSDVADQQGNQQAGTESSDNGHGPDDSNAGGVGSMSGDKSGNGVGASASAGAAAAASGKGGDE